MAEVARTSMNVLLALLTVTRMLIALTLKAVLLVLVKMDMLIMLPVTVNHALTSMNVLQRHLFATIMLLVPILMVVSAVVVTVDSMVMGSPDELLLVALTLMNAWTLMHVLLIQIAKIWMAVLPVHVKLVSVGAPISTNVNLALIHVMKTPSAKISKAVIPVHVILDGRVSEKIRPGVLSLVAVISTNALMRQTIATPRQRAPILMVGSHVPVMVMVIPEMVSKRIKEVLVVTTSMNVPLITAAVTKMPNVQILMVLSNVNVEMVSLVMVMIAVISMNVTMLH